MNSVEKTTISVGTTIKAPIQFVWEKWTSQEDIIIWNKASEDWHTTYAVNDLRAGGRFLYRMEAVDGSEGFDFEGIYDSILIKKYIEYHTMDGRRVEISFLDNGRETNIVEFFQADSTHSIELQCAGWQAILDNFKKYTETNI